MVKPRAHGIGALSSALEPGTLSMVTRAVRALQLLVTSVFGGGGRSVVKTKIEGNFQLNELEGKTDFRIP